jgi:ABC-2 type transport system permease protein
MILVMVRVMALGLWRDRAGLVLVFVLPPLVFIVFATVFSAGASGRLDIRVGVVDQIGSADSQRLVYSLQRRLGGRLTRSPNVATLEDAIESGRVDAGLVLQGDLADAPTPATVLIHPGRKAAGEILIAQVNAAAGEDLPELMLRREVARLDPLLALTPDQVRRSVGMPLGLASTPPFAAQRVLPGGDPLVIYYAGAVSILFLMFTAMQGAMSLIDERRAGLWLRLGLSTGGVAPLLGGRMLWLTALGVVQALVLFQVAAVVYGVPVLTNLTLGRRLQPAAASEERPGVASAQSVPAFDQPHRDLRPLPREPVGNQTVSEAAARQKQRCPPPRGGIEYHPGSWTENRAAHKCQAPRRRTRATAGGPSYVWLASGLKFRRIWRRLNA